LGTFSVSAPFALGMANRLPFFCWRFVGDFPGGGFIVNNGAGLVIAVGAEDCVANNGAGEADVRGVDFDGSIANNGAGGDCCDGDGFGGSTENKGAGAEGVVDDGIANNGAGVELCVGADG